MLEQVLGLQDQTCALHLFLLAIPEVSSCLDEDIGVEPNNPSKRSELVQTDLTGLTAP
jgi:hypothetical protein